MCQLMASVVRNLRAVCPVNALLNRFSQISVSPLQSKLPLLAKNSIAGTQQLSNIHTSGTHYDLMEFFDRKEVWGESSVLVGRPYRKDELRLKSNPDLHRLWYVLLKERNVLMTMQAEYNRRFELFPNPERIEKVEESMENLQDVVKERDNAVSLLESGEPLDKGGYYVRDFLGRTIYRRRQEYGIPPHMNKVYRLLHPRVFLKQNMKYLALYREKLSKKRYAFHMMEKERNRQLIEKFPHLKGKLRAKPFKEVEIV